MNLFRCRRCLYPNTKPDLWFNSDGVCSACLAYDARSTIDWSARETEFRRLIRTNAGGPHDLIIACSGGKDSTYQIVKCLELGFRPLAVTATTDHLSAIGRRNLDNISRLCDHVEVTPNRAIRNRIAKFALEELGDISWCEHHLIWSVPAREAIARGIPVVLYGENPQNEYGAGPKGSESNDRLTTEWVHEFGGLLGLRLEDVQDILGISAADLELYRKPDGVEAVFMGQYFPWDGYRNAQIAQDHGFEWHHSQVEGSFGCFENLDNLQTGIHDRLRFLKFGYSRATDIASSLLRRSSESKFGRDYNRLILANHVAAIERDWPSTDLGVSYAFILAQLGVSMAEWEAIAARFTNHDVVQWALKPESYQCFCGEQPAPSKASSSIRTGVSDRCSIDFGFSSAET